jgi:hypothetical protein
MVSPIKYSYDLLEKFCNEKNIKLAKDYSNTKLFGSTKIIFYCTSCNIENQKCFTYLIKRNSLCKRCVTIESLPKQKITMLEKYGVEHPSQSSEIREKIKQNFIKNYGVDNPSKLEYIKNKQKNTNLKKYGVEYIVHNKESKEKMIKTNLEKYGVENPLMNKEIREKLKQPCLDKYGVDNVGKSEYFIQKMMNTNNLKYNVKLPLQNAEIAEKGLKNCFKSKTFIFPSGKDIKCQGYEPFALEELVQKYDESDILTKKTDVPVIWYDDNLGKKHRHYVDIFIPSQNLCIEIKSLWTINIIKNNVFLKQDSAKKLGYNYEIWVYDNKGTKLETHL